MSRGPPLRLVGGTDMPEYVCMAISASKHKDRVEALSWAYRQISPQMPRSLQKRFRAAFVDMVVISADFDARSGSVASSSQPT